MKHLLCKILFWDDPAQGAFFGLTLLITVPWFWLLWIFRNNDTIRLLWDPDFSGNLLSKSFVAIPILVALLILTYAAFLCVRILPQVWQNPENWGKRSLMATGAILLAASAVFIFWVIIKALNTLRPDLLQEQARSYTGIAERIGIHGDGWGWFALAGITMLVIAYFLIGKIISRSAGVSCRDLIGKSVIALWSLVIASYVFFAVMALNATAKYHAAVAELSEYFGRPLAATALAEVYYNGREPDAVFWNTLKEIEANVPKVDSHVEHKFESGDDYGLVLGYPDAILPESLYAKWKTWFQANENLRKLARMLEQPLPPDERPYQDDKLPSQMLLPESMVLCRQLARWELWRLRFALEDGDIQAAKQTLQRMENICAYQRNDSFLIGNLVWIAIEHMRYQAISKVISSKGIETEWLVEQSRKFSDLEGMVPEIQQISIYGEAFFAIKTLELKSSMGKDEFGRSNVKLSALRWILPQAWWNLASNVEGLARVFMIFDWSDFPGAESDNLFVPMLSSALKTAGSTKFPSLIAELRILRGLIEAELIKRKDGNYPERMENLPLDPFSGQPLRYKMGPCVVSVPVFKKTEPKYEIIMEQRTIEAIQIWSTGPDGIDDGGIMKSPEYGSDEKKKDDFRLIIKLE